MEGRAKIGGAVVQKESEDSNSVPKLKRFDVIETEASLEDDMADLNTRIGIFTCFWTSSMFGNLDTGVIPTTLHQIMAELKITQGETAFLASVSHLTAGLASIFVAPLMKTFKVKHVLVVSLFLNASSTLLFLYSTDYYALLGARIV